MKNENSSASGKSSQEREEKNPSVTNPQWKNADGNDDDVATLNATVKDGKIECAWKVVYMEDDDDADSEQEKADRMTDS